MEQGYRIVPPRFPMTPDKAHLQRCIHASETADGQYVCFKKTGCEQQRFTSPPLAFCNDISHSSAGAQQRIDAAIKLLEGAKKHTRYNEWVSVNLFLNRAIALLQEGRK